MAPLQHACCRKCCAALLIICTVAFVTFAVLGPPSRKRLRIREPRTGIGIDRPHTRTARPTDVVVMVRANDDVAGTSQPLAGEGRVEHASDTPLAPLDAVADDEGQPEGIDVAAASCANLAAGPVDVVDSEGRACRPDDVDGGGCCPAGSSATCAKFAHSGADSVCDVQQRCCAGMIACVACCVTSSDVQGLHRDAVRSRPQFAKLNQTHPGTFSFCVARCRHGSGASFHQNRYGVSTHHCFGPLSA